MLQLVAEGSTTKEIAMILGVAAAAETHRVKVMDKLDIHSTAGLVRYAIRRGLLRSLTPTRKSPREVERFRRVLAVFPIRRASARR